MAIVLAIDGKPPLEIDVESITIGRESGSTVVFAGDDRIRVHHAVIRKVAGRWLVEAREASFLQVGSAAPARVNWLNPGDVIRLAENGPEIVFQPPMLAPPKPTPIAVPASTAPPAAASMPAATMPAATMLVTTMPATAPFARPVSIEKPVPIAKPVSMAPAVATAAIPKPAVTLAVPFPIEVVELQSLRPRATSGNGPLVRPVPRAESETHAAPREQPRRQLRALLVAANLLGLTAVLATAAWVFFGRGAGRGGAGGGGDDPKPSATRPETSSSKPSSNQQAPSAETQTAVPPVAASNETHAPNSAGKSVAAEEPAANPSATNAAPNAAGQQAPVDVHSRLSAVFVYDAKGKRQFRLGTAWNVSPRKLVTSGAVVMAIEDLKRADLSASVIAEAAQKEIRVTAMRVHPVYRQAVADALAARQEIKKLTVAAEPTDKSRSNGGKASRDKGNEAGNDVVQTARDRLATAYESQANFDLGILEIDQNLPGVLTLSSSALPQRNDTPFVMAGLPYPPDDYYFAVFAQPVRPVQCAGRTVAPADPASAGMRLTLEFLDDIDAENWSGSPVLNEAGQVAGVYSRPAGRPDGNSAQWQPHAVTWIGRLREFATDLLK